MNKTELQSAIGDVYYEVQMLLDAYRNYWGHGASGRPKLPQWIHNCVVEATMVHTRALLDFFELSRSTTRPARQLRADDIVAEDYGFTPATFPLSDKLRKRINTSIAHLSLSRTRITDRERRWEFSAFVPPILAHSAEFFRYLVGSDYPLPSHLTPKRIQTLIADTKTLNR
jgi:hypothetical protein